MKYFVSLLVVFTTLGFSSGQPLALHPDNRHYFIFNNQPVILISSAEHYGALLNTEIDYKKYLQTISQYGFNQTRVFSGAYYESDQYDSEDVKEINWDNIQNTLAPRPTKYIAPWKRSSQPGYVHGGNKFDLDQWDEAYFARLKDFCREARKNNVFLEIVFFSANYARKTWKNSPFYIGNNINNVGDVPYNEIYLLKNKELIARQIAMVKKIVTEVNEFDNVYFEICNEPYWLKGIPEVEPDIKVQQFAPEIEEWQNLISKAVADTEKNLPKKHLVAQNYANTYYKIPKVDQSVSILNFHYAFPPTAVTDNYHFNLPVSLDETGSGCVAPDRRTEAWCFIMNGGAVYSNLDFSFATDDMSGLGRNPTGNRMSGSEVRDQLKVLKDLIGTYDFVHSTPFSPEVFSSLEKDMLVYGLKKEGKDHLIYFLKKNRNTTSQFQLAVPAGTYIVKWIDPLSGKSLSASEVKHKGDKLPISIPGFQDDILLRITSK